LKTDTTFSIRSDLMTLEKLRELRERAVCVRDGFDTWVMGHRRESIGEDFLRLMNQFLTGYDPAVCPGVSQPLGVLWVTCERWNSANKLADGIDRPAMDFANDLDAAVVAILKEPPKLTKYPTPAELVVQKVSHHQIAKMWRLFRADDSPDLDAVIRELAKPGSVLTPEHVAAVDVYRLGQMGFGSQAPVSWQPPNTEGPFQIAAPPAEAAPEPSSEDKATRMIAEGANIAQIARCCNLPEHEVTLMAQEMGIVLPWNHQDVISSRGRELNAAIYGDAYLSRPIGRAADVDLGRVEVSTAGDGDEMPQPEPVDVPAEVARLFDAGNTPDAIAHELGQPLRVVKKLIGKHEQSLEESTK
jgi:hypothetical protein